MTYMEARDLLHVDRSVEIGLNKRRLAYGHSYVAFAPSRGQRNRRLSDFVAIILYLEVVRDICLPYSVLRMLQKSWKLLSKRNVGRYRPHWVSLN
jgi:hypothetical protein